MHWCKCGILPELFRAGGEAEMTDANMKPEEAYRIRLASRHQEQQRLAGWDRRLSWLRLAVFGVFLVLVWELFFGRTGMAMGWLLGPVGIFIVLMVRHESVVRRRRQVAQGVIYYEHGLARIEERWHDNGLVTTEYMQHRHPFAIDLDLFGRASLFQLLAIVQTRMAEQILARWMQVIPEPAEIRQRQEAIAELTKAVDLREKLSLLGRTVRDDVRPERLLEWGERQSVLPKGPWRIAALGVVLLTLVAVAGWYVQWWGPTPFLVGAGLEIVVALRLRRAINALLRDCTSPSRDLVVLAPLLDSLCEQSFQSERLRELQARVGRYQEKPARIISGLIRRLEMLEAQRNQLFALIGPFLLWGTQWGLAIAGWHRRHGPRLRVWLEAAAEFEVLLGLSAYAFEHPKDSYAEISDGPPCWIAKDMGHPLVPSSLCIRNDVQISSAHSLYIISGSNMSGKSTLLRAIGSNTVLAGLGLPVRALKLKMSVPAVASSIDIRDSLQEGASRFYAEISRLQQCVEIAKIHPGTLFLLDEILHGTNSHDRRIGTEAVLKTLHASGALGLVTTHDLALADIAKTIPGSSNVHFTDEVVDGRLQFDYRIRQGVVTRSNALALMRSVGLDVDENL